MTNNDIAVELDADTAKRGAADGVLAGNPGFISQQKIISVWPRPFIEVMFSQIWVPAQ